MKRLKIYVAGPYTAKNPRETQLNVDRAIEAACKIFRKGHYPYLPHLTHYIWLHPEGNFSYEEWLEWNRPWLESCNALYLMAESPGSLKELERAKRLGKKIFYTLDEIPTISRKK